MQSIDHVAKGLKKRLEIIWDRSADEIEDLIKYDPVVRLLFYSVIFQYEDVINQQQNFQKEILADLAKRLIPDIKYYASPAFGILKSYPTGTDPVELNEEKTFFTQRVINEKIIPLNYLPISKTEIVPAKISAIVNDKIIVDFTNKEGTNILKFENGFENSEYYTWIGIQISPKSLKYLKNVRLYLDYDVENINNRLYFNELVSSNWTFNNRICKVSEGLLFHKKNYNNHIFESSNFGQIIDRVSNFYRNNFINISFKDDIKEIHTPNFPKEKDKDYTNVIWLQIESKCDIPVDFFIENAVHLNAFPVINCDVKKDRLSKNEIAKQFELNEGEYFFDLWDQGTDKDKFRVRDVRLKSFDYRDVSGELRVLERIFNQSRVLFDTNLNMEDNEMNIFNEFSNIISDLKIRFKNEGINFPIYHIEANEPIKDFISYRYLTTFGESVNGGNIGEKFGYNAPGLVAKETVSLTKFYGGTGQINEDDLIDNFRGALISRGKIVTKEDIKALAYKVFGNKNIESVSIKKDVISGISYIGLSRAIKVIVQLADKKIKRQTLDFYKKDMLTQLDTNSVMGVNFVVEVIEKNNE